MEILPVLIEFGQSMRIVKKKIKIKDEEIKIETFYSFVLSNHYFLLRFIKYYVLITAVIMVGLYLQSMMK